MIAKLVGRVDWLAASRVIINVSGVGYLVHCAGRTLADLEMGAVASLFIETVVREDRIELFGFASRPEQEWFCSLTSVQGVGSRVGLSVLNALSIEELVAAISSGDAASITRAEGVGRKLAARIVGELKDKDLPVIGEKGLRSVTGGPSAEAISALMHLGYKHAEAAAAVTQAMGQVGPDGSVDQLIPEALKVLAA